MPGNQAAPGPANARWRALLAEGGPILADGAMGTMLFASGLQFGDPPEAWNVSNSEVVRRIHRGYLDAGSRIVMTNTFGGNRLRLRLHDLDKRVSELNRTAAILLRAEVDAAGGRALVAGDIGPTGEIMAPLGTLDVDEAVDVFHEQAAALIAGGVDVIWIETMSHLSEIGAAIRGARMASAEIPVIATMTFDTRGYTMMGVSPEQAARSLLEAGADAIGGNCGNGPDELLPVIAKMAAVAPDAVLVAKSNAGMPELIDLRAVYRADPPTMAEAAVGVPGGRGADHRGVLRLVAGPPGGHGRGPRSAAPRLSGPESARRALRVVRADDRTGDVGIDRPASRRLTQSTQRAGATAQRGARRAAPGERPACQDAGSGPQATNSPARIRPPVSVTRSPTRALTRPSGRTTVRVPATSTVRVPSPHVRIKCSPPAKIPIEPGRPSGSSTPVIRSSGQPSTIDGGGALAQPPTTPSSAARATALTRLRTEISGRSRPVARPPQPASRADSPVG